MKLLLSGIAIIAALASAVPALAQRTGPGTYASYGSGPGVTPPGGYGPSSPLANVPVGSPGLPPAEPWGTVPASTRAPLPPAANFPGLSVQ